MRIGVIGLGAMGRQIALKLHGAGHDVTVWDRDAVKTRQLVDAGARAATTVSDTLQGELALSVLFDDAAIRSVLMGQGGLSAASSDVVHACLSTITMGFADELVAFHSAHGIRFVGLPMLGRPEVIANGALNLLAAGPSDLLDRIEPALDCLGRFWRLGASPPEAFCAKLAANFMISGAIEAMAEAIAVLKFNGVNADRFIDLITGTLFGALVYKSYGPTVAGKAPPFRSGLKMPIKDNASFLDAAAKGALHLPLADAVRNNFARALELGAGQEDWATALAWVAQGGRSPA